MAGESSITPTDYNFRVRQARAGTDSSGGWKFPQKPKNPEPPKSPIGQMEDEFQSQKEIIKPAKSVTYTIARPYRKTFDNPITVNIDDKLEKEFAYLSITHGLEIGTQRNAILQKIVVDMTRNTDIQTRVIIMNKGNDPNAFVTPDGSIFVNQAVFRVCLIIKNSLFQQDKI